ncbi:DUF1801 domain-containing protein [Brevundimonas sp.]|uniref:DUF1801 domain-containing protein n=1 Tax=Brevundimonas sp. TaxID=1871086 RepID=UPI002D68EE51|nr:DUF1801 domain-containing protein [Brevundimonas sp.]HYD29057.1 DUF1801 domain-containing protein [Brevundimonas sp.]
MEKGPAAANPDAYVAGLDGWRRDRVEALRAAVRRVDGLAEVIKWGHLVYLSNGPALLIRAESGRVLLGFWRGQRLRDLEPRLKPGGQYEMATISLAEGDMIDAAVVTDLTRAAVGLNAALGDPTKDLKKEPSA